METSNILQLSPLFIINIVLFIFSAILSFLLFTKIQTITGQKKKLENLSYEINELAHQAKLIIKSDMELKLFQENVEDKLKKLSLLRNLISSSLNILDKDELFSKIDEELINDLGFKKAAIFTYPVDYAIRNINFSPQNIESFKTIIDKKGSLTKAISVVSSSALQNSPDLKDTLTDLGFENFIFAAITIGSQISSIFVLADCTLSASITKAEKEILSIICMYLSQCLDNIKLFEALYHAGEELEGKIKEKTFQLSRSLDEIKEMNKLKSEFISSVSHELRTPLTSIKGFSSLLVAEKFGELPPEAKKRLIKVDTNVDKLVDMVNALLDIARIESGRTEVNIVPADIVQLAKDSGELLLPQMVEKNIKFETTLPPQLQVYMDKKLIDRVFINIISNAIKFTPNDGTITIQYKVADDTATIQISDTGCGMNKEDCENVFKEFYRTPSALNQGIKGTGLGLSLVQRIVETHGGKVWAESEIDKGTTLYFTLKLVK